MFDHVDSTVFMLIAFRIIAILVGAFLMWLGFLLFKIGYFEKAGELQAAWGNRRLLLKQVAPGVFFALFGTIIVCVGTWKPVSIQSQGITISEPFVAVLQKIASNQQLDDADRLVIATWLQRRVQGTANYEAWNPNVTID